MFLEKINFSFNFSHYIFFYSNLSKGFLCGKIYFFLNMRQYIKIFFIFVPYIYIAMLKKIYKMFNYIKLYI